MPVEVTKFWLPWDFFGDDETMSQFSQASGPIVTADQDNATTGPCSRRQAPAVGRCWKMTYRPVVAPDAGAQDVYGGVRLASQLPGGGNNRTQLMLAPRVEKGATKITASVAGAVGGEQVSFWFGARNFDNFATDEMPTLLTTSWQTITAPITTNTPYEHILMPFAWKSYSQTEIVFYFDNVIISR